MSQQSHWNPSGRYAGSLHSSEVVNVRELKFCEGCGVLFIRFRGSDSQFCFDCPQPFVTTEGECNAQTLE